MLLFISLVKINYLLKNELTNVNVGIMEIFNGPINKDFRWDLTHIKST